MTMRSVAPSSPPGQSDGWPRGDHDDSGHSGWSLDAVKLGPLMEQTEGASEVIVGLIDGPVVATHPHLATEHIRVLGSQPERSVAETLGFAHAHGTYVAGILSARRGSPAPSICPGCTLLVRPIFVQSAADAVTPTATPNEVSDAIVDCVDAGALVLNLSVALERASPDRHRALEAALNHAARRGVIVVAAAGNQGTVGGSPITRHPWTIPVVACDLGGRPSGWSNLGNSIARRGVMAPGENITSLDAGGTTIAYSGTSAGAPFVTGAIALLWSLFRDASPQHVKAAVARSTRRRISIVPPVLDAWDAHQRLGGRR
jgi:subtilisin family serine protease